MKRLIIATLLFGLGQPAILAQGKKLKPTIVPNIEAPAKPWTTDPPGADVPDPDDVKAQLYADCLAKIGAQGNLKPPPSPKRCDVFKP